MTNSFEHANVWPKDSEMYKRVSPSRIRCAVVTDLVVGGEDASTVAQEFMKHRLSTSKKFYIQHWGSQESMRISMSCYTKFLNNIDCKKIQDDRERHMSKNKAPTKIEVKSWLKENERKFHLLGMDMEQDKNLSGCIDEMTDDEIDMSIGKFNSNLNLLSHTLKFHLYAYSKLLILYSIYLLFSLLLS